LDSPQKSLLECVPLDQTTKNVPSPTKSTLLFVYDESQCTLLLSLLNTARLLFIKSESSVVSPFDSALILLNALYKKHLKSYVKHAESFHYFVS
jgi:hypothetical protein